MGTRLQLFGSSGEDDDYSDDEDDDEDDDNRMKGKAKSKGKGGYYDWYMTKTKLEMGRAGGSDDDDY